MLYTKIYMQIYRYPMLYICQINTFFPVKVKISGKRGKTDKMYENV